MRRQLVDGPNSVIKGLSRPEVQVVGDHAYVSLQGCITYMLVRGPKGLDVLAGARPEEVEKRSKSKQAYRVWNEVVDGAGGKALLVLWLIEWVGVRMHARGVAARWTVFATCF